MSSMDLKCDICYLDMPKKDMFPNDCCNACVCKPCAQKCDNKCPGCRTVWAVAKDNVDVVKVPFEPTEEQMLDFDFDLLFREDTSYTPESLQAYVDHHFFLYQGNVYKRLGEQVDSVHKRFKGGCPLPMAVRYFSGTNTTPNIRLCEWAPYIEHVRVSKVCSFERTYDLSSDINRDSMRKIMPIIEFVENMCGDKVDYFNQVLGLKRKFPKDAVKRTGDPVFVVIGAAGSGKSSTIPKLVDALFGASQRYNISGMREFSQGAALKAKVCNYMNTICDDLLDKKPTMVQEGTIRSLAGADQIGVQRNRTLMWFLMEPKHYQFLPLAGNRRIVEFRMGGRYNSNYPELAKVHECLEQYGDIYCKYIMSQVADLDCIDADLYNENQQELAMDVEFDPSDTPQEKVCNYFKSQIINDPMHWGTLPCDLPKHKDAIQAISAAYGTVDKKLTIGVFTKFYKAIGLKTRCTSDGSKPYTISIRQQLQNFCNAVGINGVAFNAMFKGKGCRLYIPDDDEEEEEEEAEEQIVEIVTPAASADSAVYLELERIKKENEMMRQMFMQMHQQGIIQMPAAEPKELPAAEPKPKLQAKLSCKVKPKLKATLKPKATSM